VWSVATGQVEGHQAPPIVNNGVMFVATPGNQMLAIEAKTGNILWRYYGDKVYFASADCVLVALDRPIHRQMPRGSPCRRRRAARATPRPARKSGLPRSMTTRKPTLPGSPGAGTV
jgi:alcohol dehydrogenase (cytochrome c)